MSCTLLSAFFNDEDTVSVGKWADHIDRTATTLSTLRLSFKVIYSKTSDATFTDLAEAVAVFCPRSPPPAVFFSAIKQFRSRPPLLMAVVKVNGVNYMVN